MASIAAIPDPRIRAIAVMRFLEGKSWDVDGAAAEMRCRYDVDSIDDIPADEFTDILVRFSK